jgi:uncharacterized protein Veg
MLTDLDHHYIQERGDLDLSARNTCQKIKQDLDSFVGKKVMLRANRGRKKIVEEVGILETTYPNIFVVKIDEGANRVRRVSYTYADVLTKTVELRVFEPSKLSTRKELVSG